MEQHYEYKEVIVNMDMVIVKKLGRFTTILRGNEAEEALNKEREHNLNRNIKKFVTLEEKFEGCVEILKRLNWIKQEKSSLEEAIEELKKHFGNSLEQTDYRYDLYRYQDALQRYQQETVRLVYNYNQLVKEGGNELKLLLNELELPHNLDK